jgi:RNA polymerase sigma factor (sigma-70 family)
MATSQVSEALQHLRRAVLLQDGAGLTDGELLASFIDRRDEAAFAALVRRHGPMVWGVCRRALVSHHDAEDAFQVTFLVLVRKAASILPRAMVANWLYGVAHQTALKARAMLAKRKGRERQVKEMPEPAAVDEDLWGDLQPLLDQELSRLPDKYRAVIVLCDLEGKARKEAARQLKLPEGTVGSRLARARTMLARRLTRRGMALSGGALAAVLSREAASASVPASVVSSTIQAVPAAVHAAATGVISAKVAVLADGVIRTMWLAKLRAVVAVILALGFLAAGATALSRLAAGQGDRPATASHTPPATEKRLRTPRKHEREKEGFTAWGMQVGGLQAGLGFRPGEHRPYHTGETVRLVVRVRNVGKKDVRFSYFNEFFYENPPGVTDSEGKSVYLEGSGFGGEARLVEVNLAPGKEVTLCETNLELKPARAVGKERPVWTLLGTGKFRLQHENVGGGNIGTGKTKFDPVLSKLATGKLELEVRDADKVPEKKEKEPFAAWGKEVGGLQAGLGYDPGQKRAYRHGETVRLVLRVRNVRKEAVKFQYLPQFFAEEPPAVTGGQGAPIRLPRNSAAGLVHQPVQVNLAPGQEVVLYDPKFKLRPASEKGADNPPDNADYTLYGTGKFQIQYKRVIGKSSAGPEPDPRLSKLATGQLELVIKSEPADLQKWTRGKGVVDVCFAGPWLDPLKLRSSLKTTVPETDLDFRLACGEGGGENRSFVRVSMRVTPENVRRLLALQAELSPRGYLLDPKETRVWSYPVDSNLGRQVRALVPQFREAVERDLKKRIPKVQCHLKRNRFLQYEVPGTKARGFIDVYEIMPGMPDTDTAVAPEEELHLPHLGLWIRLYYYGVSDEDAATRDAHDAIRKVFRRAVEPFLKLEPGAVARDGNSKWRGPSRK